MGRVTRSACLVAVFGLGMAATYIVNNSEVMDMGFLPARKKKDTLETERLWGDPRAPSSVLIVRVEGPITTSKPPQAVALVSSSFANGYDIQETLEQAAKDDVVGAVVVQFATPGGTVAAAQAIHDGIMAVKAKGKPVVAHIDGLSASGGVYAMVGADRILAAPGSIVGSIGVTMGSHHTYRDVVSISQGFGAGVETSAPIQTRAYTAGRGKDILSPWREPTEEEVQAIERMLDNQYRKFVAHVAEHRDLDETVIRDSLGALIFDEWQAQELGLIDGMGTRRSAVAEAAGRAKLGTDYDVVAPKQEKKGLLRLLLTGSTETAPVAAMPPMRGILAYWDAGF